MNLDSSSWGPISELVFCAKCGTVKSKRRQVLQVQAVKTFLLKLQPDTLFTATAFRPVFKEKRNRRLLNQLHRTHSEPGRVTIHHGLRLLISVSIKEFTALMIEKKFAYINLNESIFGLRVL